MLYSLYSYLYYLLRHKALMFIRFKNPSLYSIDMTGCYILREKHIWFCFVLCNRGIFFLRTPYVCLNRGYLYSFPCLFFIYSCYKNCWIWLIFFDSYTCLGIIIALIIIIILFIFFIINNVICLIISNNMTIREICSPLIRIVVWLW